MDLYFAIMAKLISDISIISVRMIANAKLYLAPKKKNALTPQPCFVTSAD
jgi:hypothetical protein